MPGCSASRRQGIVVCGITTNHCCETTYRVGAGQHYLMNSSPGVARLGDGP